MSEYTEVEQPFLQQLINGMLNKPNLLSMLRTSSAFMDTDGGPRIKVVWLRKHGASLDV